MNLIWHIVRKDLMGARWLLAAWLVLLMTPIVLGWWALSGDEAAFFVSVPFQANYSVLWIFLHAAMALFISVAVAHEDRLVGSSVHWPVLPISGGRLLLAKVAALLLILWLLPVLVSLPWWLVNGFGGGDLLQGVFLQTVLVIPVMVVALTVASVTSSYGRFLAGSLALLLLLLFGLGLAVGPGQVESGAAAVRPDVLVSRRWLTFAVAVGTMIAVVIHQHLRRRLTLSVGLLALGAAAGGLILKGWPWSIVPEQVDSVSPIPLARPAIGIEWGETTIRRSQPLRGLRPGVAWMMIENVATVTGLGPREAWTGRIRSARLTWPDGTEISLGGKAIQMGGGFIEPEGSGSEVFRIRDQVRLWFHAEIPETLLARMVQEPPLLNADVEGYVHRGDILAESPILAGRALASDSLRMEILSTERTSPFDQTVVVVLSQPARFFWQTNTPVDRSRGPFIPLARGTVFNGSDRAAVGTAGRWGGVNTLATSTRLFAGVEIARRTQGVSAPMVRPSPRNQVAERDEGWLDDAIYVWTRAVLLGRLNTSFEANPLTVPAGFDAPLPPIDQGLPPVFPRAPASLTEPGR